MGLLSCPVLARHVVVCVCVAFGRLQGNGGNGLDNPPCRDPSFQCAIMPQVMTSDVYLTLYIQRNKCSCTADTFPFPRAPVNNPSLEGLPAFCAVDLGSAILQPIRQSQWGSFLARCRRVMSWCVCGVWSTSRQWGEWIGQPSCRDPSFQLLPIKILHTPAAV